MPRRGPTTGAEPNRGDEHTHFAEDIWEWLKEYRNVLLLGLTILIVGTVIVVIRSRTSERRNTRAQRAIGSFFYEQTGTDQSGTRIEQIKSDLSRFRDLSGVGPWLHLQLATVYYTSRRYERAIETLRKLRERHGGTQPAKLAKAYLRGIRNERSFMNETIPKKKRSLEKRRDREQLIFDVSDQELSELFADSSDTSAPGSTDQP